MYKPIYLNASQIAGFIGRHNYVKQHEAFEKLWKRISPTSYRDALTRNDKQTEDEILQDIVTRHPAIQKTLDVAQTVSHDSSTAVAQAVDEAHTVIAETENLTPEEQKVVDHELKTRTFTKYGIETEHTVIETLRVQYDLQLVEGGGVYHSKYMGTTRHETPWYIGGKIDAITPDQTTIIEIKNRVNRLFMRPAEYEHVQCQTYLHLFDTAEKALLVETLRIPGAPEAINVIHLNRNDVVWKEYVKAMQRGLDALLEVIETPELQDTYMNSKRQTAFWRTRMNLHDDASV